MNGDLATVLLELALDEARRRKRLRAFLLEERKRRGGGDAEQYPQPRMADYLGVSLRAYQSWEAAQRKPRPNSIDDLLELLGYDYYSGGPATPDEPAEPAPDEDDPEALRRELESLRRRVDRLEKERRARVQADRRDQPAGASRAKPA